MKEIEEKPGKPESLKVFLKHHKMNWTHEWVEDHGAINYKEFHKIWTTHVEPLRAENDKMRVSRAQWRSAAISATAGLILALLALIFK